MQPIHQNASFQLLLSTTEELILEKGCQQTTLQDIIKRSGLSKGAIYHYVKSKDELLGLLLQKRIDGISQRFYESVQQGGQGLANPLDAILSGLSYIYDPKDVTNLIFIYLMSKKDDPVIGEMLTGIYEWGIQASKEWIEHGQKGGVIPQELDAEKISTLFTIITNGIRVHTIVAPEAKLFAPSDLYQMMYQILAK